MESGSLSIMEKCPRFGQCNAPICPLDSNQDIRDSLADEPKCTLAKSIRFRIGEDSGLPRQGLKKREWAALQRYQNQSSEERERFKRRGRESLKQHRKAPVGDEKGELSLVSK